MLTIYIFIFMCIKPMYITNKTLFNNFCFNSYRGIVQNIDYFKYDNDYMFCIKLS